jgi:glycosyltransferase involved in cell wall biosynthesis
MSELLSIAIPTRNRARYLKELLLSIEEQMKNNDNIQNDVKVYIFDNASDDNTNEVVKSFDMGIIYQKNNENIGVGPNVYQAYTGVEGKYVWVIGDDELLEKDTVNFIHQLIIDYNPHLIINRGKGFKTFTEPWIFSSYSDFAVTCKQYNLRLLIAHSLISCNLILKSCFDAKLALEKMDTYYGHFYGMIKGLKTFPGLVLFPPQETIIVRAQRAGWAAGIDGIKSENIAGEHAKYLEWVTKEYGL